MINDPLGDLLTRIRNGLSAGKSVVESPSSKLRANVLEVLKREGYIRDFSVVKKDNGGSSVSVELKYSEGRPAIREISRVSLRAAAFTRVSRMCPVFTTVLASRFCPHRRAFSPIRKRRRRTWAARSCAGYSNRLKGKKGRIRNVTYSKTPD